MFVGHYGVAFAAKRASPRLPLGLLFLAVQLLDVLFAVFVFLGIEKLRIVPGFTAYNPYDLYWMPYTHSLAGALVWSILAGWLFWLASGRLPRRERRTASVVLAGAVFSHFVLDVPMHTPDMALWPGAGAPKIGLGLWNHRIASILAELVVLVAGGWIYLRGSRARSRFARIGTITFSGLPRRADRLDAVPARSDERPGLRGLGAGGLHRARDPGALSSTGAGCRRLRSSLFTAWSDSSPSSACFSWPFCSPRPRGGSALRTRRFSRSAEPCSRSFRARRGSRSIRRWRSPCSSRRFCSMRPTTPRRGT